MPLKKLRLYLPDERSKDGAGKPGHLSKFGCTAGDTIALLEAVALHSGRSTFVPPGPTKLGDPTLTYEPCGCPGSFRAGSCEGSPY